MYYFILRVFLHQLDNNQDDAEVNHPQCGCPGVRDVVEALFYDVRTLVAGDWIKPHGGAIKEGQDGADILIGRLNFI